MANYPYIITVAPYLEHWLLNANNHKTLRTAQLKVRQLIMSDLKRVFIILGPVVEAIDIS